MSNEAKKALEEFLNADKLVYEALYESSEKFIALSPKYTHRDIEPYSMNIRLEEEA